MKIFFICGWLLCTSILVFRKWVSISILEHLFLCGFGLVCIDHCMAQDQFVEGICVYSILLSVFYNDLTTYYFSKCWILLGIILILWIPSFNWISSIMAFCVYGGMFLLLYVIKREWIGIADGIGICFFSLFLGFERMNIALFLGVLIGILWFMISKRKYIPFLSCLSIGVWIAYLKGYSLWFLLYDILMIRK